MIVTSVKVPTSGLKAKAAQPTSKLAMPPNPLNRATISGILVICTIRAAVPPMMPPITMPMAIHWKSTISWPTSVATMAISMPSDEIALPRRAVAGELSCFKP